MQLRFGIKILLLSSALITLSSGMLGPIYALFVEELGGDVFTAGSSYALYALFMGFVMFFVSRWEDHVKHQDRLVLWGGLLRSLGVTGLFFISSVEELYVIQILLGFSDAISIPAFDALYSKYIKNGTEASSWGLWEVQYTIVEAFAALLGSALALYFGFKPLFLLMGVVCLMGTLVIDYLRRVDVHGRLRKAYVRTGNRARFKRK